MTNYKTHLVIFWKLSYYKSNPRLNFITIISCPTFGFVAQVMDEIARLEAQVEIKSPVEKFFGFYRNNMHHLVQMFPKNIKSFQLQEEMRSGLAVWLIGNMTSVR